MARRKYALDFEDNNLSSLSKIEVSVDFQVLEKYISDEIE